MHFTSQYNFLNDGECESSIPCLSNKQEASGPYPGLEPGILAILIACAGRAFCHDGFELHTDLLMLLFNHTPVDSPHGTDHLAELSLSGLSPDCVL